ncbi:MAG TPA: DUF1648 domain-containing protein [Vicinamibacterales bacterium]
MGRLFALQNTISPSRLSRHAGLAILLILLGTAVFLVLRYPALPDVLPVHFNRDGAANGWQFRTVGRVLLPVFVQLALSVSFGAIAALLLSRSTEGHSPDAPDVRAASAAAETVLLMALIWVSFQAYAAFALVRMWTSAQGGLGRVYVALEVAGLVLTGAAAVRGHRRVGRPIPRPFVAEHWRFGQLYKNGDDPALFVPTRDGSRWTLNFGRPTAASLLGVVLCVGVIGPTLILFLALRYNF